MPQEERDSANLGEALKRQLDIAASAASSSTSSAVYEDILAATPSNHAGAAVHIALGRAHLGLGNSVAASAAFRKALEIDQDSGAAHFHHARLLADMGDIRGAITAYEHCLRIDHRDVSAHLNLGNLHESLGNLDDALTSYDRALAVGPDFIPTLRNIAMTLRQKGMPRSALAVLEHAAKIAPQDAAVRMLVATAMLQLGDFAAGWPLYEARFESPDEYKLHRKQTPPPFWAGQDVTGKRILIWREQGVGDEIMYAGMIPDMLSRGAACDFICSSRMRPVFQRSFPRLHFPDTAVLAQYDFQISIASLGQHFRPSFASFPKHQGYLKSDAAQVARLRDRYRDAARGRRIVGLSWRSTNVQIGALKGAGLRDLAPVLTTSGVMFVNLQYGDCEEELAKVKADLGVEIFQDPEIDPMKDMDAFFAQVAAMDLVVSTSNTTVHAAGAQNIPVWTLLPEGKGVLWYWFTARGDSPWYPSARLYRASCFVPAAPWREVAHRVAEDLNVWLRDLA